MLTSTGLTRWCGDGKETDLPLTNSLERKGRLGSASTGTQVPTKDIFLQLMNLFFSQESPSQ